MQNVINVINDFYRKYKNALKIVLYDELKILNPLELKPGVKIEALYFIVQNLLACINSRSSRIHYSYSLLRC